MDLAERAGTGAGGRATGAPPPSRVRRRGRPDPGPGARHGPRALRAVPERRSRRRPRAAPGSTSYGSHLDVQTFDVTDHLVPGANVLAAVLSDGWWRGKVGFTREVDCYGTELALLVQLDADLDDGSRVTVGTGPGWTTSTGEILRADLIDGQGEDLRLRPDGWDRPGFDDGDWSDAGVVEADFTVLSASPAPPVRRVEELRPVAVRRLPSGYHVVDLGQNINGWVRLDRPRPGGHRGHPRPRRGARRRRRGDDRPPEARSTS